MRNMIISGVLLVSVLGCQGTTSVAGAVSGCQVTLPTAGTYGPNILYAGTDFAASPDGPAAPTEYELVVDHAANTLAKVDLTLLAGQGIWVYGQDASDWHVASYNGAIGGTQRFDTSGLAGGIPGEIEESIYFTGSAQARLDLFECGAATPTLSKMIGWGLTDAGTVMDAEAPSSIPHGR
jgi:hypothetical protein